MSKLFKLKEWLTLDEAAQHISTAIGESVEKKDILRLALDTHLSLSVNLVNGAQARCGNVVGSDGAVYYDFPPIFTPELVKKMLIQGAVENIDEQLKVLKSLRLEDDLFLNLGDEVKSVRGIWDLSMWGGERLDLEHEYQMLTNGPAVTLETIDGVILRRGEMACQLQESFDENEFQQGSKAHKKVLEKTIIDERLNDEQAQELREKYKGWRKEYLSSQAGKKTEENYYPAGGLPQDSVLIIKTDEILRFLTSLDSDGDSAGKKLGSRERNTLLVLIASLCKEAGINYEARGIASVIERVTEINGTRISDDKIRDILKLLPDAVILRSR
jgi:hypothetical protein